MNPNGILFGLNARLDVGGSFLATTANGIQFGERGVYNANGGQPADVLTINPSAFLFNQISKGNITNRSVASAGQNLIGEDITGLRVPDGKSLLLLGGDVNIEGGGLRAYNGRIELGSLAAPGIVGFNVASDSLSFNIPEGVERGNISLTNGAEINVRGSGGGDIAFTAKDVNVSEVSIVRAGIDKKLGSLTSKSGDIQINATGTVTLTDVNSRISNVLDEEALGKSGNVNIITDSLIVSNDASLSTSTFGIGDAGNISIFASDKVLVNDGFIGSSVQSRARGNGGNISVIANLLSITDGSLLDVSTFGNGNAGNILLKVNDAISLTGDSSLDSNVEAGAVGNGGNINLEAGNNISILGASIFSSVEGDAVENGGSINLKAGSTISLADTSIFGNVEAGAVGNGGNINIEAGSLSITDGTQIQTLVRRQNDGKAAGKGNAGNVNVNVRGAINISGTKDGIPSGIRSVLGRGAEGRGGNITITSSSLSLADQAQLNSGTFGQGNAGNISIQVKDFVSLDNSNIFSDANEGSVGNGGNINIASASLSLTNNSQILTGLVGKSADLPGGKGNGGDVNINVRDAVNISGNRDTFPSTISTKLGVGAEGRSGNITINAGSFSLLDTATIDTATQGIGNAGNLLIQAKDLVNFDNVNISSIVEAGGVGNGGNIKIEAGSLSLTNSALLSTGVSAKTDLPAGRGNGGNVDINVRDKIIFARPLSGSNGIITGVESGVEGNAGNVTINTGSLEVSDGSEIQSITSGIGNSGNITINARDFISFDSSKNNNGNPSRIVNAVQAGAKGNAGSINITTGSLNMINGALIGGSTFGNGNAGNILIQANKSISFTSSNIFANVWAGAIGNAGNVSIQAGSLIFKDGAKIITSLQPKDDNRSGGIGNAGNVNINVNGAIVFAGIKDASSIGIDGSSGVDNFVGLGATGNAGNITIKADSFSLLDGAQMNASTGGEGNAGDISLTARKSDISNNSSFLNTTIGRGNAGSIFIQLSEDISLDSSNIVSGVIGGVGDSGDIDITARNVTAKNSSVVTGVSSANQIGNISLPPGKGQGGDIRINASDSIIFSGYSANGFSTGIGSLTETGASGAAGNISLTSSNIRIADGAIVSAATSNQDKGGDITINANIFELFNGAQVFTTTFGSGNAGNILLNVKDRITISGSDPTFNQRVALVQENFRKTGAGDEKINEALNNNGAASGLFANTAPGSIGNGGSIIIDPREFTISDGGRISVNSEGAGTAGSISIKGGNLTLDKASITARSASRDGGNIKFALSDKFVLRRNSEISTTAGTAGTGGDGGNIDINARFVVAIPKENSNINANAFEGNGGRVQINTQGIFGIGFSPQETKLSDITVSSQFGVSGTADIDSPNNSFIPNNLTELNKATIDTNAIIATSCIARDKKSGTFYFKGSGGLSARPGNAPLSTYSTGSVSNLPEQELSTQQRRPWKKGDSIVEPQGMYQLPNGKIFMGNKCSET
ncbi:hypothetical protein DSM106972_072260 [Dulcicalothrix desertica PCC 7102]|uniref:Filamentous haemagglutinin FhaB/tRNA nuclease CdiA-like TPS domain-containing protein n=3 Tax=Dulcicalothrix desertica TaxID=32056 RepID=A0A3S1AXI0_9CYAN|nr:hypothetical protein DSM106972_072260 [Dulcicalothrix desertica PCC 7102]